MREGEPRALAARAAVVAAGTFLSRLLGLARDVSLAALFPVASTDAFWVAFTLPNALRQLLAEGAVSSAVVPMLAEVREQQGEPEAREFFAKLRGLSLVTLAVVTAGGVVFAPALVDLFAHGLRERAGQFERTVALSRWVFPYIVFMGSAALGSAVLTTHRRFFVISFAPCLLNVAFLAAAFGCRDSLRRRGLDPTLALAWGALLGGALQLAAQLPSLARLGYLGRPRLDFGDARVRRVLLRIGPVALGLGIYAVDLVVCRRLLAASGEGAQSYFSWAQRLCDFPQGVFAMALQTAALPSLSALAARGNDEEFAATFSYAVRLSLFVALPVSCALVFLAEPLVVAFFQRGQFHAYDAAQTAVALAWQGASVWCVAAVRQLVPIFFAQGDTRTPVIVSVVDLGALLALAYVLTPGMGHVGVSVAVAGSSFVQMICLWALASRRMPALRSSRIGRATVKVLAASLLAGLAGHYAAAWLRASPSFAPSTLLPGVAGLTAFAVTFLTAAVVLRCEELTLLHLPRRRRKTLPA